MPNENSQEQPKSNLDTLLDLNFGISTPSSPTGSPKDGQLVEEEQVEAAEPAKAEVEPTEAKPEPKPDSAKSELSADVLKSIHEDVKAIKAGSEKPLSPETKKALDFADISEEDFNAAITSRDGFNKVLRQVYSAGKEHAIAAAREASMLEIPKIVQSQVSQYTAINNMVTDFYRDNADLVPYRKFVGYVANQIASAHPDWDYGKLFTEAAKEVRTQLGDAIKRADAEPNENNGAAGARKPAFAKPPGGRQPAVVQSEKSKRLAAVLGV